MKKIIALFLALLTLFSFCACGNTEDGSKSTKESANGTRTEESKELVHVEKEYEMPETIVYDDNDIKFTVTGISTDHNGKVELQYRAENGTSYEVSLRLWKFVFNNISSDVVENLDLDPQSSREDYFSFINGVEQLLFSEIHEMRFLLEVKISDGSFMGKEDQKICRLVPRNVEPEPNKYDTFHPDEQAKTVFSNQALAIYGNSYHYGKEGKKSYEYYYYLENKTDEILRIIFVNQKMDGHGSANFDITIPVGGIGFISVILPYAKWESYHLSEPVQDISFTLRIYRCHSEGEEPYIMDLEENIQYQPVYFDHPKYSQN